MAHIAKKVKKLASIQFFNLKVLLNGRGLSKFKKHYKLKGELGRGGFGIVYRGVRICDELPVAVKFIDRHQVRDWGKLEDERVPMEICMLARCVNVPGVIKLLDWYSMPEGFLIVMARPYPCVDLFDFIKSHKKLNEDLARFLFRQIALTIHDCAQQKVLHRDLKDENIVIDLVNGETFLIDFGAATVLKKSHYTDFQGTRLYCPPEWFLHSVYLGREAAVWSLGVLLYNMLNGKLPFRNEKEICTSHLLGPIPFYTKCSKNAIDLIEKCLRFEPNKRCNLETILKHPWIRTPCSEWCTLTACTYQKSFDDRQQLYDTVRLDRVSGAERPEPSCAESGVGSASSISPSTSSSFPTRRRHAEPMVSAGGGGGGAPMIPSSRRQQPQQQPHQRSRGRQTKTSLFGGGGGSGSPPTINSRNFVEVTRLRHRNIAPGRMGKAHSVCHGLHLSSSTPRIAYSRIQNPEEIWIRAPAVGPFNLHKRSTDSGQHSALFASTAALPTKPPSRESFYGRPDAILAF